MAILAVKEGVQPHLIRLVAVLANVAGEMGTELTITAGIDGQHSMTSLHYALRAIDVRTRDLSVADKERLIAGLRLELGADYDVVLEDDHLHLEFDPK